MKRLLFISLWLGFLLYAERKRPLREEVESVKRRYPVNATVGFISAAIMAVSEFPATRIAAKLVEKRRLGLLPALHLGQPTEVVASFVLLDYSIYLWHVLLHKVPLLWRFHIAHHIDIDLDASTALRFHFGELIFSLLWRTSTILLLGIRTRPLQIWETFLISEILFHHSNLRMPLPAERLLNKLVVTPRMHGIHHSIIEAETNSNWSSGLTVWDRLHGTLRLNVPQSEIKIGVPAYQQKAQTGLRQTLLLPFLPQRYAWMLADGGRPQRRFYPNTRSGELHLAA